MAVSLFRIDPSNKRVDGDDVTHQISGQICGWAETTSISHSTKSERAVSNYEQLVHNYAGLLAAIVGVLLFTYMLAKLIRAHFEHRYWSLRANAESHRADSKSRDDTIADRALEALVGVGVALEHERLRAMAFRALFALGLLASLALAAVLATIWVGR